MGEQRQGRDTLTPIDPVTGRFGTPVPVHDPYNLSTFELTGFIPAGKGAHGLYVSRDSKDLFITDRGEGSVSVLDFATNSVDSKWQIPGSASPDMGGVSADGKVLWLSGRDGSEVYALSTTRRRLLARIPVGDGPHGLCVIQQPGRCSFGHTRVFS